MNSQKPISSIPFITHGKNGPLIHFAHANGYPPSCYQPLFSQLITRYQILSMLQRPLWKGSDPNEIMDWHPLSEDLIHFFNQQSIKSIIGIGHSLGGIVTLRAAINYPERFKALILIDPVLFSPYLIFLRRLLNFNQLIYHFHPLIKSASRRKRVFPDIDFIYRSFRRKSVFQYLDD
ncbi:alpha/beta fold hydrolase [Chloroflexota bacterium]